MNTCNSINSLALGKVLKKYNLNLKNKKQVLLLARRKSANWSSLYRLARRLQFKQTVLDQQQKK